MTEIAMQRPVYENKVNWNTYISLAGFALVIGANLISFGEFRAKVGEFDRSVSTLEDNVLTWRIQHMEYHRERATELAREHARVDERLKALEARVAEINTLSFRIQTLETGAASLTRSVGELTAAISNLTGDLRVIREGVTRLEQGQQRQSEGQASRQQN